MGRIRFYRSFSQLEVFKDFARWVSPWIEEITQIVNGQLQFGENIASVGPYDVVFTGSSDVQTVEHTLRLVPRGTMVLKQTAGISIYAPSGSAYTWTSSKIYLQATGAGTVTIYVI